MKGKQIEDIPPQKILKMVTTYLDDRFGISTESLSDFGLYLASKGRVYLGPKRIIEKPKIVTLGIIIARVSRSVKPSTNLLQLFGRQVTKNYIVLSPDQTKSFVKGEDLRLSEEQIGTCTDGYILLRYLEYPLGCGFLQAKTVKNLLPKAKRLELKYI